MTIEPASPVAGQPMVFHITLTDPDGVSYDGTNFNFGNSGIGGSTPEPCTKFGPWDPPARDPASATQTVNVTHTYFEAGSYTATFFFDAGPFDCVDSVTGRGDRPYASSATGTVTVQVAPAS
ncbi:MAG TPA: PKD domain-containing protein [Acidimicrobiales bacterium]|nr:PKD domain-containing protein [Acidimicrobiales bacterium]